jgi:DNA-binding transcriptional ArsR family regulator
MSDLPRGLLEHDARLDVLCCLDGEEPLTAGAIGIRTGQSETVLAYHLKRLVSHAVVRRLADQGGPIRYEARLDDHPGWVRQVVEAHRRRREK